MQLIYLESSFKTFSMCGIYVYIIISFTYLAKSEYLPGIEPIPFHFPLNILIVTSQRPYIVFGQFGSLRDFYTVDKLKISSYCLAIYTVLWT